MRYDLSGILYSVEFDIGIDFYPAIGAGEDAPTRPLEREPGENAPPPEVQPHNKDPPMTIDDLLHANLPILWYENEEGKRWAPGPKCYESPFEHPPPDEFDCQVSRFPSEVTTNYVVVDPETHISRPVLIGHASVSEDLAEAMIRSGMSYRQATLLCATSCSRCLNALCFHYDLGGYPIDSEEYANEKTRCELCEPIEYEQGP